MIAGEALLDAFINANILFFIGYGLWLVARYALKAAGLKHAHSIQLNLLNAVFVAIIFAPLVAMIFNAAKKSGMTGGMNVNLSDMVVAYYLNGGFEMEASRFESLILTRDRFMLSVLTADGLIAQTAIAIFATGLILGLVRLCTSVVCLRRIVAQSYEWRSCGRLRIRVSDRTLVPFSTRGLWHYYVVIPSHMLLSVHETKVAIAHELQHIRQGDLEWEVVLEALKPFFFLNPAFRAWKSEVEHLRELNCDAKVLSRGRINVRDYCETLLSVCQKTLRKDRAFLLAVPKVTLVTADRTSLFEERRSFLERRILSALELRRPTARPLLFIAVCVPLLAAMSMSTLSIQQPGDWSHDRLMLSTVVNLERLEKINKLSTFGRIRD